LVKWLEFDLFWGQSLVAEGSLQGVQIVGSNGYQGALAADVLVQLILQIDEAVVGGLREGHVPEHSGHGIRTNLGRRRVNLEHLPLGGLHKLELGGFQSGKVEL